MSQMFYVRIGDQTTGPVTPRQLRQMAADGTLTESDHVRLADQETWYRTTQVDGLFPDTTSSNHLSDQPQRNAIRRKRIVLCGEIAGVAVLAIALVVTAVFWSTTEALNPSGIGWSLDDVQQKWGEPQGWYWDRKGSQRYRGPGRIDYRAKHAGECTEEIQVLGLPDDLECFNVRSWIEYTDDPWDEDVLPPWSRRATAMPAQVAHADAATIARWFLAVYYRFADESIDHDESIHAESCKCGRVAIDLAFMATQTTIISSIDVRPLTLDHTPQSILVRNHRASEAMRWEHDVERTIALADPDLPDTKRDAWLDNNNATPDHWNRVLRMGSRMLALRYPIRSNRLPYVVASGVSNIRVPDSDLYTMGWRLAGVGYEEPDDLPVSFLQTCSDGPFTHNMAIAAVKEFNRVTDGEIDAVTVAEALEDAATNFDRIRRLEPSTWGCWFAASHLPDQVSTPSDAGEYAIRVIIKEWKREEGEVNHATSKVLIYFVYVPPNREITFKHVRMGWCHLVNPGDAW